MDPFGFDAAQYAAAAAWASVAVLIGTGVVIVLQLRHAEEVRRDQNRPYVVPSIVVEQGFVFVFAVENVGRTAARDVRVQFEPPVQSATFPEFSAVRMLNEPTPTMPPGQRFRANWESSFTVFGENGPYDLPMSYEVAVSYRDMDGHELPSERYILDFRVWEGQNRGAKGLPELVQAAEKLLEEQKKWTHSASGGIAVHSRNAERDIRRRDRSWHVTRSFAQARKEDWRAGIFFWIDLWQRRYGLGRR